MSVIRSLVSKKKKRFQERGYDLDLSYTTERVIAMGFPAEKIEGIYRNRRDEVIRFLEEVHGDHYKIYNLCSERHYDPCFFHNRVARFPFDDHNTPPFELITDFCKDMDDHLNEHPDNIAVVHCKAGKGRTGLMISAYLLYSKQCNTAHDALQFFAINRTDDMKGVTIPSQKRYVHYFERFTREHTYMTPRYELKGIRFHSVPMFDYKGSCDPWFKVSLMDELVFNSRNSIRPVFDHDKDSMDFRISNLTISGDVKIEFFHRETFSNVEMFHFWFNTKFIDPANPVFTREQLDRAHKEKRKKNFKPGFRLELILNLVGVEDDSISMESRDWGRPDSMYESNALITDLGSSLGNSADFDRLFHNMRPRGSFLENRNPDFYNFDMNEGDGEVVLMGFSASDKSYLCTDESLEFASYSQEFSDERHFQSLHQNLARLSMRASQSLASRRKTTGQSNMRSEYRPTTLADQFLSPHSTDAEQIQRLAAALRDITADLIGRIAKPPQLSANADVQALSDLESWCRFMMQILSHVKSSVEKHQLDIAVAFGDYSQLTDLRQDEDEDDEEDDEEKRCAEDDVQEQSENTPALPRKNTDGTEKWLTDIHSASSNPSKVRARIDILLENGNKMLREIKSWFEELHDRVNPLKGNIEQAKAIISIAYAASQM